MENETTDLILPPSPSQAPDPERVAFQAFRAKHTNEIRYAESLAERVLPDDIGPLMQDASEALAWGSRMSVLAKWAESFYVVARKHRLPPKGSLTELEREVDLDAAVHEERRMVGTLNEIADSLKRRCSLCQSYLKARSQEIGLTPPLDA